MIEIIISVTKELWAPVPLGVIDEITIVFLLEPDYRAFLCIKQWRQNVKYWILTDCRLYRTMKICVSFLVSVTRVYGLWCIPAYLMSMWPPADDVISILFLFAVDAIHALTTYIGTLPTEYKYFQPWVTVGFSGNKQQYVYLLGCSTDFLFAGEWCRSRSGIHTE